MELIKHDQGVMYLNDIDQFFVFVTETIKDFLHEILFIYWSTKESKFIGTSFDGLQESSDALQTLGGILKVAFDLFNVTTRQFDIFISNDGLFFIRGVGRAMNGIIVGENEPISAFRIN